MTKRVLPVLIVQHAPHEHSAAVRRALEAQRVSTQVVHPYLGEAYPKASEIQGMISLGGPMGANDSAEHPWIKIETELLKACILDEKPTVGICLGGQMMANAMGGRVEKNRVAEVGWFPIQVLKAGIQDPVVGAAGAAPTVYHWHGDTFHLPPEAVLLAKSQHCPRQAYKIGEHAYGFQFHPEADHQLVLEWLSLDGIDDDIDEWKRVHGNETVQDLKSQRAHAFRGERGSLKITTAIGALFRTRDYQPVERGFRDHLEGMATARAMVAIEFEGSGGKKHHLRGVILSFLSISSGEFVIFQEQTTLLWPIRIDDITRVALA